MKIKKGDQVKIVLGKDRGKQGKVLQVMPKDRKVLVEGINIYKRHVRKTRDFEGGVIDLTKPVDISNLALVCPACKKATRVGFRVSGNGKIRVCKKCQKEIKDVKAA